MRQTISATDSRSRMGGDCKRCYHSCRFHFPGPVQLNEEGVVRGFWQRLGAAVGLCVFMAGGVAAQELRDRDRTLAASRQIADDLRRARLHYGPFYLLSSIQLSDIGYDQEYFIPVSDTSSGFRFGVSAPQRLYFTPNRKTYFSVDVTPQW